jgi:hypothetical protein
MLGTAAHEETVTALLPAMRQALSAKV